MPRFEKRLHTLGTIDWDQLGPLARDSNGGPTHTIELQADWAHLMANNEILGDGWIGETHFDYAPVWDTTHHRNAATDGHDEMDDIGQPPGLELPLDRQSNLDY